MKLSTLLQQHMKYSTEPHALSNSLGDGYLLNKNRIYKQARIRAIQAGFKFSSGAHNSYRVLSLSQLTTILESKTIPYFDNVTVLKEIENKIPKQTDWMEISDNLKGNSVLHEACHAHAHTQLNSVDPCLRSFLEESYANMCELLAILDAEDQTHRAFLELNSYVYMLDDRVHLIRAEKQIGRLPLARFMLLSYLHANYLRETVDVDRICRLALDKRTDPATLKSLRRLSKIAFNLNPHFREFTTRFHFKLNGVRPNLEGDFLAEIERSEPAKSFLRNIL